MANKKKPSSVKKTTAKQQLKKSNLPLIVVATVVVCAAVLAVVFGNGPIDDSQPSGGGQRISAGKHLAIPVSEISSTASFFPVEVDGTEMEVLAVRASDGTIRTAFNTCQSCYTSGKGYYVQQGTIWSVRTAGITLHRIRSRSKPAAASHGQFSLRTRLHLRIRFKSPMIF